ncbi:MAG: ribosome biogenesis GTPase Der [Cyclobacteriaceae bacterium]|nr:ribosome biogenesis GTPase Der [Cyclobacteriaceae bacterium]MCB0498916.1 ribosome biogenesis GTPase Der [Cyclobacteriaceae bacterium]MCB9237570.1 ribosome biogenesis GTPase Der [Flammeovirgaceae bacterium]MCO5270328.1 ribosome biogenesis GTPase Der [Cyclobacteriaceae bacterium]MCW5902304.1 ribosome biogenesis GTPase Der [Cyclobacteriaceae bacterium]
MTNIVAIVGRPNVGKSTLFNRLVEKREAIMDDVPGVTRDRHYGHAEWSGRFFSVIDTGGYVTGSDDKFESQIRKQVEAAIEDCTAIIFMVDGRAGLTGYDKEFANLVRRFKKPVFVAVNKADTPDKTPLANEFYELGMGEVYPISAENGSGTGELLDEVVKTFETEGMEDPNEGIPKIAIVGRPNVGKSSFLNVLLGEDRSIVTDVAGTTRDAVHSRYKMYGNDFILIDTAGIRKKSKVKEDIEFYSVLRSMKAMEDSDVCIVLVDAERGLEQQDTAIISLAQKQGKGIVIMVNKWDLIDKDTKTADEVKKAMLEKLVPATYIPIIFASVLTKQRIFQVMEKAVAVYHNKVKKVPTSKLNDALLPEIARYPPPAIKGKLVQIKYITQVKAKTPSFAFFCNLPQYIKTPYMRFLENKLRANFDFEGTPIRLFFRKK